MALAQVQVMQAPAVQNQRLRPGAATDSMHHPSHETACPVTGQNSQALRRTPCGPPRPAPVTVLRRAHSESPALVMPCGRTVRSHSHGPNVMIIGWPGATGSVPVPQCCGLRKLVCYAARLPSRVVSRCSSCQCGTKRSGRQVKQVVHVQSSERTWHKFKSCRRFTFRGCQCGGSSD